MKTFRTPRRLVGRTAGTGLALGLVLLALTACNSAAKVSDEDLAVLRADRVKQMLADPKLKAVPVDVRPGDVFAKGHLPGAVHLTLPEMVEHDPRLRGAGVIIVYQQNADDVLSPAAAKKLMRLRYGNVYDFRGGVAEWQAAGGELVAGR